MFVHFSYAEINELIHIFDQRLKCSFVLHDSITLKLICFNIIFISLICSGLQIVFLLALCLV